MNKIQTLAEYQQLAKRTCTDLGDFSKNERHMTMGVITEIGETLDIFKRLLAYNKPMDLVNFGEEIADTSWYIVNNCTFQDLTLEDEGEFKGIVEDIEKILLEGTFSKNDLPKELRTEAILILILGTYTAPGETIFGAPIVQLATLSVITSWYDLDYFQCLTNNINKLKVRYPEKFTEEAAENRNLDAERAELEK